MRGPALGSSYRRSLLDAELEHLVGSFRGVVLDVGGRRTRRGRLRPPDQGVRRWILLNLDPGAAPDILATAECLPLRAGSVDRILCQEVIQYVDRYESMLAEFRRVLAPSGEVVLSSPLLHRLDHVTDRHRFSAGRLAEIFARAGFQVESVSQQGRFFTTLAHMLRQAAAHAPSRTLRALVAVPLLPVTACLRLLDRLPATARSSFLSSYTTGYVVRARRP